MKCPECGFIQGARDHCKQCGVGMSPIGPDPHPSMASRMPAIIPAADRISAHEGDKAISSFSDPGPASGGSGAPDLRAAAAAPAIAAEAPRGETAEASDAGAAGGSRAGSFHGTGGQLLVIHLVNTLLTMITLGVYVFWGKVKVRRYMLSQTEFEGDRFEYHGTGKELLRGWTKAMLFFFLPFVALSFLPMLFGGSEAAEGIVGLIQLGLILGFTPLIIVSARRYRMSRTSWRGLRFSFRGVQMDFVKLFFKGALLNIVTLGLYTPIFQTKWQDFMIAHTYFGNRRFDFHGIGKELFRPFLIALVLFPFTLGLSWIWYTATKMRYYWDHTTLGDARFRCAVKATDLFVIYLTNALLVLVTFGLGFAWAQTRMARFYLDRIFLEGPLDLTQIHQEAQAASAAGEELAGFFDLDLGWA